MAARRRTKASSPLIQDLKARGLGVLFHPFLFMDIASGNTLSDPYTGAGTQPAYPWRGRITCDPAPGAAGSPDKTSAAATQVAAFFGAAAVSDFAVLGTTVTYTGAADWGLRRMVLHYAHLCRGGRRRRCLPDRFGTRRPHAMCAMRATTYPAVAALKTLAADVRSILGSTTKIGYAADWSEYANHQTGDAPGEVLFNLDPLWADSNIDFIGIDNYMPLADWRDGTAHLDYDAENGPTSIHDPAYLAANIQGGEDYDWYYASDADRDAQTRTAITDGLGKPWVFRAKDVWNWWANAHYDRPGGTESASPTASCRKPNRSGSPSSAARPSTRARTSPTSSTIPNRRKAALPYYSNGARDDLIQRRFLEAHLKFWSDGANNPISPVYARADGRYGQHLSVVLGRAALSVLSGARRYLGRCRQLPPRPLAERAAGRGANWPISSPNSAPARRSPRSTSRIFPVSSRASPSPTR